jgi:hypothetical protein
VALYYADMAYLPRQDVQELSDKRLVCTGFSSG